MVLKEGVVRRLGPKVGRACSPLFGAFGAPSDHRAADVLLARDKMRGPCPHGMAAG